MLVDLKFSTEKVADGYLVAFHTPDGKRSDLEVLPTEKEAMEFIEACIVRLAGMPQVKRVAEIRRAG